jgi:hypothetical protein
MKVNEKVNLKYPGQMAVRNRKGRSGKEEHENG